MVDTEYSHVNLLEVEDQATNLGIDPPSSTSASRACRSAASTAASATSASRPNRKAHGHRHKRQEEIYVLVHGSATMKVGDDVIELEPWSAVRVPPHVMRGIKGGPGRRRGDRDRRAEHRARRRRRARSELDLGGLTLSLFPDSAEVADGELTIGGVARVRARGRVRHAARRLLRGDDPRARARVPRGGAGRARRLRDEGVPERRAAAAARARRGSAPTSRRSASCASRSARACRASGSSCTATTSRTRSSRAAAEARAAYVVLDSVEELARARAAGVERMLVRITPGIEADTHESIRTGHLGSKFGVDARGGGVARGAGGRAARPRRLAAARALGGARDGRVAEPLPRRDAAGRRASSTSAAGSACRRSRASARRRSRSSSDVLVGGLAADAQVILEPGRSLVGQAGVTLYRVGSVKRSGDRTWVAVDGGISDNARPQLYDARYTAVVATRMDAATTGTFGVAGKHCESGDVLIDAVALAEPRRGDLLAVPATGAYTLAMSSNYNARAASGGGARRERRRARDPAARDARRRARARGVGGRRGARRDRHRRRRRDRACDRAAADGRRARPWSLPTSTSPSRRSFAPIWPYPTTCSISSTSCTTEFGRLDVLVNNAGGVFETWQQDRRREPRRTHARDTARVRRDGR